MLPPKKVVFMKTSEKLQKAFEKWQSTQPLSEADKKRLSRRFTVDFNYNSNHIEGNTLTYGQTELLLLFGKVIGEADVNDVHDMTASNVSLRMMTEEMAAKAPLTQNFIRTLHKTLLREDYTVYKNMPGGFQTSYVIHAGQYKTRPNSVITRYGDRFDYASPEETPALMADLVDWYNKEEQSGEMPAVDLAILFHYRYIRIHPFEDGNGRIARLLVNFILARHGYPMIVVRSRNKHAYIEALHKADMNVGTAPSDGANATLAQIRPFQKYMTDLIISEIEGDTLFATEKSEDIWWYDGERVQFRTPNYGKILRELQVEPNSTYASLQKITGISISALQKLMQSLVDKGYIEKSDKNGWRVFITPSM